jgi:hypothetical protein
MRKRDPKHDALFNSYRKEKNTVKPIIKENSNSGWQLHPRRRLGSGLFHTESHPDLRREQSTAERHPGTTVQFVDLLHYCRGNRYLQTLPN